MFCRYCGKSIADDSDFCTYCGKALHSGTGSPLPAEKTEKDKTGHKYHYNRLDFFMMALCYLALGIFLFLNVKMAPFYGGWKFLAYILEAVLAIFLTWVTKEKIEGKYR